MKFGLVLGKFMPVHAGHMELIEYAKSKCDMLIVLVCVNKNEPINGAMRFNWVRELYKNRSDIDLYFTDKDMPDSPYSDREVSKVWAEYLKTLLPPISIIFGSEKYVEYVAEYMEIDFDVFDEQRNTVPISATMIRENPYKYWDMIPSVVKPFYTKKICIYGSDSCGKSTLTIDLANHYKTAYVPEMARCLIEWGNLNIDDLTLAHLEEFAKMQSEAVKSMIQFSNGLLFCDSDNLTTQIYSEVYCGEVTDEIKRYDDINYDLYLFLDYDTPYVEEGQRNLGHRREEMFNRFKAELDKRDKKYVLISGSWEERFKKAVEAVNELIK